MSVTGLLRVKNEARWIQRCIKSILPVCDMILVFDDHSTDGTPDLCRDLGATVHVSHFEGVDEARDKNWMLDQVGGSDWILMIDGDEELAPGAEWQLIVDMGKTVPFGRAKAISLDVLYLWDREDQVRMDGVYGRFLRQSVFRPGSARFQCVKPPNFHCGNVPASIRFPYVRSEAQLLHYGYMHADDRIRKHRWYNSIDPNNAREDYYRHIVIGDVLPATTKTIHAGPLDLRALADVLKTPPILL